MRLIRVLWLTCYAWLSVPYHETAIGWMWRTNRGAACREILTALEDCSGNLVHAADHLNISRRHLYRFVYRANLWPAVDALRERANDPPDDIARARAALLGE